jgi:hypothetical protein
MSIAIVTVAYRILLVFYTPGVDEATSTINPLKLQDLFGIHDPDNEVIEYFYNFAAIPTGDSVNGRRFIESRAPLYRPDIEQYVIHCDDDVCDTEGCHCTHIDELPFNKTIQIVIMNYTPESEFMAHHIIHLHGHSFALMTMGYAELDDVTGRWTRHNQDIQCYSENPDICTKARWTNQRPALNKDNQPIKNDVLLPSRGYAVIRFRTNNPGYWFLHCHMDPDFLAGMAMIVNTAPDKHPPLHEDFPDCQDFKWAADEYNEYLTAARNNRLGITPTAPPTEEPGQYMFDMVNYVLLKLQINFSYSN